MRTSEERIEELHRRMKKRENDKNNRSFMLKSGAVCAAGLAITVAMAFVISKAPGFDSDADMTGIPGSIIAAHAALGYVAIGLLAFCLGVSVTVFCFRLRKHSEDKGDDRKH